MNQWSRVLSVILVSSVLSGCVGPLFGSQTPAHQGENLGGVARSDDAGITLVEKNTISDVKSLASASISHLLIEPGNADVLYAGTYAHGLLKTRDRGETWTILPFEPAFIDDIAIHPYATQTVYVATVWENRGRVYKSEDAGETWHEIYIEPVAGTRVTSITLNPENPQHLYIGTTVNASGIATLAESKNGGGTWSNLFTNHTSIEGIYVDSVDTRNIYTIEAGDVYRSQDHGLNWTALKEDGHEREVPVFEGDPTVVLPHPSISGVIYVGTTYSLYRSENYGDTWEEVDTIASARGVAVSAISLDPFTERVVFASQKALYAWMGDSWAITDIESARRISAIVHDPANRDMLYVGYRAVQ